MSLARLDKRSATNIMYSMSTPNDPSNYPSYGGNSSYGGDQNSNNYGSNSGYGQNSGTPYPPTSGYVNPETGSESGRPLQIPAGVKLPPAEPIPFGFKRFFTSQWHVYLGVLFLPMIVAVIGFLVLLLPQVISAADSGSEEIPAGVTVSMIIFYVLLLALSLVSRLVIYKIALKDTRGVKPTWSNAFKDVPWGNGILVFILLFVAVFAVFAVLGLLSYALANVSGALSAIVSLVGMFGMIFLYPFMVMIPLYAIDGKTSAAGAFGAAWRDVKAQYWQVLGAIILLSLACMGLMLVTIGFAGIIVGPVQVLGLVFIYRWVSEGGSAGQAGPDAGYSGAPGQSYQHPEQPGGYMSMY